MVEGRRRSKRLLSKQENSVDHSNKSLNIAKTKKRKIHQTIREYELELGKGFDFIIGCDEAGRGPLAGPVGTGACCVVGNNILDEVNDSKKLNETIRVKLYGELSKSLSVLKATTHVTEKRIDKINILQASLEGMKLSCCKLIKDLRLKHSEKLKILILVDGTFTFDIDPIKDVKVEVRAIKKGDSKCYSIARASILAKVERDRIMVKLDEKFPLYGFAQHKGYPTKLHIKRLNKHGPCKAHRRSFAPVRNCLS